MRAAIVTNLYPPRVRGGAEVSTAALVNDLARMSCEVRVVTLAPWDGPRDWGVEAVRVRRPYDAFSSVLAGTAAKAAWHAVELVDGRTGRSIANSLREWDPDVVLTQNLTGFGSGALATIRSGLPAHVPIVHTVRDYGLICVRATAFHGGHSGCRASLPCQARRLAALSASRAISGVVGISESVLDVHLRSGLFRGVPRTVIHNALGHFVPATVPRSPSVGYLGQLTEEKGVLDLALAYLVSVERFGLADLELRIAGVGEARVERRLRELLPGAPVRFMGRVSAREFLPGITVLVVPSRWAEPYGRVVLEGAAAGCSLVVSRAGGLPEAVADARALVPGLSVRMVSPGDVEELASAIAASVLEKGRAVLPLAALEPSVGAQYLSFIESLRRAS